MDYIEQLGSSVWGAHPMDWPTPPERRPYWWQFAARRNLARLEHVFGRLSNEQLAAYWQEVSFGQSVFEDAGTYMLRCYEAMMGYPTEAPYTYKQAAADLLSEAPRHDQ